MLATVMIFFMVVMFLVNRFPQFLEIQNFSKLSKEYKCSPQKEIIRF